MELMVTLALAAVVLGIGVPSFREFSRNNRMVTIANDFLAGVQVARTEAIKQQVTAGGVALCPSTNPGDANPTCAADTARQSKRQPHPQSHDENGRDRGHNRRHAESYENRTRLQHDIQRTIRTRLLSPDSQPLRHAIGPASHVPVLTLPLP